MVLNALMGRPGGLHKLKIIVKFHKKAFLPGWMIEALFNPSEITVQKSMNWSTEKLPGKQSPQKSFRHGNPAQLSLDLYFDTYAEKRDVRLFTKQLDTLVTITGENHEPPLCTLIWGTFDISGDLMSQWILRSMSQRFDLFLPDGTPVRATASCTFEQFQEGALQAKLLNLMSSDVDKAHTVQRGETLSSIAARHYDDPGQWRVIAKANQIINPRELSPGQRLIIPKLTQGHD
ncbi:MAG: LysM peptidoglycan-binding domain-containing protein [Anaerolineae bacterium]|nr:LysM peptidoglycan-binding domain-containing protein [Anaerolineae bacterium]